MTPLLEPEINEPSAVPPRRLSHDFVELQRESAGKSLTIDELAQVLQARGFTLFILLLALPFCLPISIPGLSLPFGVVIFLLGLRIAMGRKPSLPAGILSRRITAKSLARMIKIGLGISRRIEKFARPRMHFLRRWPGMINLIGVGIASGGLQLLLPLPPLIPLSNTLPGISIAFLAIGLIERDGVFVLAGYAMNLFAWTYFAFMFTMGAEGVRYFYHWFGW